MSPSRPVGRPAIAELLNAARVYCLERFGHWSDAYGKLCAAEKDRVVEPGGSWRYTDEAYALFPRYNVLDAIRRQVERWGPADFSSRAEPRTGPPTQAGRARAGRKSRG